MWEPAFWAPGLLCRHSGKYEGAIREYINHQLEEDIMSDQLSLKEFTDPFTGKPVKEGK